MLTVATMTLWALIVAGHQAADLAPVGSFASVRQTSGQDPHCYGWSLKLWRHNGQLIGLASRYQGPCADPPCRALTNVTHEARTGRLTFGAFDSKFEGTLKGSEIAGTLNGERLALLRDDNTMNARSDARLDAWCDFWRGISRCEGVAEACRSLRRQQP